jgi:tripartite-type tricarboxylate transporter receptor subunit TctC
MKKLLLVLAALTVSVSAFATEYRVINPTAPGNATDFVFRIIAEEYRKQTGNVLVQEFVPGGNMIPAVNRFKQSKELTVMLGTTGIHVFNHLTFPELNYSDADFDFVTMVYEQVVVWYSRSDSKFKTLADVEAALKRNEKIFVATDNILGEYNVMAAQSKNNGQPEIVKFKAASEGLTAVIGGQLDIAVSSLSPLYINSSDAGKINLLATSSSKPITLANGKVLPPSRDILKTNQFSGGLIISITPGIKTNEAKKLKEDLLTVVNSPSVRTKLLEMSMAPIVSSPEETVTRIKSYRTHLQALLKK